MSSQHHRDNTMKILTNHQSRPILEQHNLTTEELKEFDYLKDGEGSFFRYKGNVYDLGQFMVWNNTSKPNWDGYRCDSYFSGIVIKFSTDYDEVTVGTYLQ